MKEDEGIQVWLKFITSIFTFVLSITVPIAQVFSGNRGGLFIGGDSFFLISIIALIVSMVVALMYLISPYVSFPLNFWQVSKYSSYLKKTNPEINTPKEIKSVEVVRPPITITARTIAMGSVILLIISGLKFIKIGLDVKLDPEILNNDLVIWQSLLYILAILSATYCLVYVTHSLIQKNKWSTNKERRADKAIALAKKMDAFKVFPKVTFVGCWDDTKVMPFRFVTEVDIKDEKYQIFTDQDAKYLMGVIKIKNEQD